MPTIKSLLKIGGDPEDAKRALRETREELRQFGRTNVAAHAEIRAEAAKAELDRLRERLQRLSQQTATPRVKISMARTLEQIDRLEAKLDRLDHKTVNVRVKVGDRIAEGLAGFTGGIPLIGGLFSGLSSAVSSLGLDASTATAGIVALGVALVALASSLAAALAGLAALATAFAGVLAPAVAIGVAVLTRVVAIVKAVHDQEKAHAADSAQIQAAAQQRAAANQALSDAYRNVAEQAKAAKQAEEDAQRAIPRDRLGVDQAKLSLKEAKKALRDFRQETGTAGQDFDKLFRRFSDVNFQGDPSKMLALLRKHGASISGDQGLKFQQLVLDQRGAVLTLSDALHKLHNDQQTNNEFAKKGIQAYEPYNAAVRQVAAAQRQVKTATERATAQAAKSNAEFAKLSPAEQRFGKALVGLGRTLKRAFTPAVDAVLHGATKGLAAFGKAATDPKVERALKRLGGALGDSFARFAQLLTTPEMRRLFERFADAGTKIFPKLAGALGNILTVLARIGGAAVGRNGLTGLVDAFDKWTGKLERNTRNAKDLRGKVQGVVDTFKDWVKKIGAVADALIDVGKWIDHHKKAIEGLAGLWVAYKVAAFVALAGIRKRLFTVLGGAAATEGMTAAGTGLGEALVAGIIGYVGVHLAAKLVRVIANIIHPGMFHTPTQKEVSQALLDSVRKAVGAPSPKDVSAPEGTTHPAAGPVGQHPAHGPVSVRPRPRVSQLQIEASALAGSGTDEEIRQWVGDHPNGGYAAMRAALRRVHRTVSALPHVAIHNRRPTNVPGGKDPRGVFTAGNFDISHLGLGAGLRSFALRSADAVGTGGGGDTNVTVPITVAGGGPPNPEVLGALLERRLKRLGR